MSLCMSTSNCGKTVLKKALKVTDTNPKLSSTIIKNMPYQYPYNIAISDSMEIILVHQELDIESALSLSFSEDGSCDCMRLQTTYDATERTRQR